jgi:hypothetical protein
MVACNASAQDAHVPPRISSNWELKGLHLGTSTQDVQTAIPAATCKTETFDAGLSTCRDSNNTLAGKSAMVTVRLLDGKAVLIEIANINQAQAKTAAAALAQKYGPASEVRADSYTPPLGDHVVRDQKHLWFDGDIQIVVAPFQWSSKGRWPYAAVTLMDVAKHDREWIVRLKAKGGNSEPAAAIDL